MRSDLFKLAVRSALLATFLITTSSAALLTITFSSSATGTIGDSTFTGANFTITALANSANAVPLSSINPIFSNLDTFLQHDSAKIDIAGLGIFDLITPTSTIVASDVGVAIFSRFPGGGDLISGLQNGALQNYLLDSSIGPVTDRNITIFQWTNPPFNTSGGILIMQTTFNTVGGTFGVVASDSSIPEPATAALILPALFLLARFRYRG